MNCKHRICYSFAAKTGLGKDLRLFIRVEQYPGIAYSDIGFREAVEPKPPVCFAFEPVGFCVSCKAECKTLGPSVQQN